MGRAFPELFHETFHIYGVPGTPMVITNEHHDEAIITSHDNFMMEWLARGVTIRMGGVSYVADYPMDGATAKRVAIAGTIGVCFTIGRSIREARERHIDPFDHLIGTLAGTPYAHAQVIAAGKIVEVERRTAEGFVRGRARIESLNGSEPDAALLEIAFQNENLIARMGELVLATVPDLICILDAETAEPITTEDLRYGQRVTVMGVSVPPIMRTPAALAVWGPRHFGYDVEYLPVEARRTGERKIGARGGQ
jgi:DUF917 family protein